MPLKSDLRRYNVDTRPCEICSCTEWIPWHWDSISNAKAPGMATKFCGIAICTRCGVGRLAQVIQKPDTHYANGDYQTDRNFQNQNRLDPAIGRAIADRANAAYLSIFGLENLGTLRGETICDVGCAAGGFIDYFANVAKDIIAIEPCVFYTNSLRERNYHTYHTADHAIQDWAGKIDYLFLLETIEHVQDPVQLLNDCKQLLRPGGEMLITTPNFNYLMADVFNQIKYLYYQTAHNWYFNKASLKCCTDIVGGFETLKAATYQRDKLDRILMTILGADKPHETIKMMLFNDKDLNDAFKAFLEKNDWGHYLYCKLKLLDNEA